MLMPIPWEASMRWKLCSIFLIMSCSDYDLSKLEKTVDPLPFETTLVPEREPPAPVGVGAVTGVICATDGEGPVVAAEVWVEIDSVQYSDQTDAEGLFLLEDLPAGTHTVTAEKGSFSTTFEVLIEENQLLELPVEECLDGNINIAVIQGEFDSIENVLLSMAIEFDLYPVISSADSVALLRDPSALAAYEILLINCDFALEWGGHQHEITQNLAEFVANGGSLYVSDWSFYVLETTFPDAIDFLGNDLDPWEPLAGPQGSVTAQVVDEDLKASLGKDEAEVVFDQWGWAVPQAVGDAVVLVEASVTVVDLWGTESSFVSPLVVRLDHGDGTVYYTAFHNEAQITGDMLVILEQIVENL
jgi:hypothetical protein